ncbi:MAG: class I SAM-dependent methyltransferase, partial [Chloroflexia bacterium]
RRGYALQRIWLEKLLTDRVEQLRGEIRQLERKVEAFGEREEENRRGYALQRIWLEKLLTDRAGASVEKRPTPERVTPLEWMAPLDDHDYFVFENAFRGSSAEVRRKQEVYLSLFTNGGPIVDIGCGRGEFLELLQEHNIPAYGIEINEQMVRLCREKGLDVRQEEAFAHLDSLPNASLGGIFLAHVLEHLPIARLSEFARLSFQKLRPGSCLVAETPNPTCLWTFARPFYLDMSHTRPLHPEALSLLFEMAGFRVEIRYLNPVPDQERLVILPPEESGADESAVDQVIWQNFGRLNDLIYGYQDFALIARK